MDMKVWVLTREINEYDQDGAYFEAVFKSKPTVKQIAEQLAGSGCAKGDIMNALALCEHILTGGGRQGIEHEWFNLEEVDAV